MPVDDPVPPKLFPVDVPFPVPLPVLLCPELLFPNPSQEEKPELLDPLLLEVPVDPEDKPRPEELLTFVVGLFKLDPLEPKLEPKLEPVDPEDDPVVDELLPVELRLGFNPVEPKLEVPPPADPILFNPDPVELLDPDEKMDELEEPVPLFNPDPVELLDPDEKMDELEEPVPLLNADPVELLDPDEKMDELEEPVPVDPCLFNPDPVELLDPDEKMDELEEPVPAVPDPVELLDLDGNKDDPKLVPVEPRFGTKPGLLG